MTAADRRLRLIHYDAPAGPRIVLFGPIDVDLAPLQEFFRNMSRHGRDARLDEQGFIVSSGGIQILACRTGWTGTSRTARYRRGLVRTAGDPVRFEWARSADEWDDLAVLLEGLVEADAAGHQYLEPDLVVSKGEYSDAILR